MKKKKPMTRVITTKRKPPIERTVDEQIQIMWKVIDEAKTYLEDEKSTSEEKRHWAKVLCDTMGVLNKLLASRREKPPEDEDLGSLLLTFPRKFRRTILRRVKKWRRKSLSNDYSRTSNTQHRSRNT